MKRWFGILCLVVVLSPLALSVWQPAWLRQAVIRQVTERVNAATPYHLQVGAIRWNMLHGLGLKELHIVSKKSGVELFSASSLYIGIDWLPLFHHELRFSHLRLDEPVLLIPLQDQEWTMERSGKAEAPSIEIDRIDIEDGKIILHPPHGASDRDVVLSDCALHARLSPQALSLEHFDFKMGSGSAEAHGDVSLRSAWKARLSLDTHRLPLEQFLRLTAAPMGLRLPHSGHSLITAGPHSATFITAGRLADAPLDASGAWRSEENQKAGSYDAKVNWADVPMNDVWPGPLFQGAHLTAHLQASGRGFLPDVHGELLVRRSGGNGRPDQTVRASVQWVKGAGPVQCTAHYGGLTLQATGQADLRNVSASGDFSIAASSLSELSPALADAAGTLKAQGRFAVSERGWSIDGEGSGQNGFWKGHTMKSLQWTFHDDPQSLVIHGSAEDLQLEAGQKNSWDVTSFSGSLSGTAPNWQIEIAPTLRNGAAIDTGGQLTKMRNRWDFLSDHFRLDAPGSGSWQATAPVRAMWNGQNRAECQNLILSQDAQHVDLHDFLWSPEESRIDLSLHVDPSTFNALQSAVEFSKGSSLDVQWKAQGRWPALQSRGTLKGQADRLEVKTIGLTLKHWDCSVESTDQVFDIHPCSAELSKGSISLTGHSALPLLQASLRGTKVSVQYGKTFKGTGTLALDLGGTLESPELRGHLDLSNAIYNPMPEKKKKPSTPATSSSTVTSPLWRNTLIDVSAQWPRDVWYRDGASSIETRADLRVRKSKGETAWRLSGTITSVRGNYSYLGRSFNIDSAQLQFTDSQGFDPLMNVEASYPAEAVVVYLDITGLASKPVLKLRSSPPMTDQDIISIIAFGQPVSELRSSGGVTTNQQMEAAAGSVLGGYVTNRLRSTGFAPLQFDVLNVQSTAQGSQLTVGRYLTRRLYVSYGQTLSATAGKAFDADYFLTDRWILEAETGTTEGNYMDLLFRYPINGSKTDTTSNLLQSPFRNTLDLPSTLGQPPLPSAPAP